MKVAGDSRDSDYSFSFGFSINEKSSVHTLFPELGLKYLLGASVSNFKVNNKKF